MQDWINQIHELSIEQLQELLKELGPIAVIQKELQAKVLMTRIEGLNRQMALLLAEPLKEVKQEPVAKQLAHLLVQNRFTHIELVNLRALCGDGGAILFDRARTLYDDSPTAKGREDLFTELFTKGREREKTSEKEFTAEDAQRGMEEDFRDLGQEAERVRMQDHLRETYGIESAQDFYLMLQAMKYAEKENPVLVNTRTMSARNKLVRKACSLYDNARSLGTTPKTIYEWRNRDPRKMNPHAVYKKPDGQEIWGNGDPVIRDRNGQPRRIATTLFGTSVPDNEVPDMRDVEEEVKKAYPLEEPEN